MHLSTTAARARAFVCKPRAAVLMPPTCPLGARPLGGVDGGCPRRGRLALIFFFARACTIVPTYRDAAMLCRSP